jgi:purine-cytosine permease-like protein
MVDIAADGRRTIERHLIDFVPLEERHGTVRNQFKFWFLSNFQFYSIALGFVGPSMGLSLFYTILAALSGVLTGTIFTALHASQGPELGLPQMVQSRAQFGRHGILIPLFGSLFNFVAFNVVDTILISQGLNSIFGLSIPLVSVALAFLGTALAIWGHDWLHLAFRVMFWLSLPLYTILSFAPAVHHAAPVPLPPTDSHWSAFAAQFTACFAYNITYAPCVSDYTRYLPANTPRITLVAAVYGGAVLSAIWLIALGAWMAAEYGVTDSLVGLRQSGNAMIPHFGTVLVIVSATALAVTMGLNAYSAMLTFATGIACFRPLRPSTNRRIAIGLSIMAAWLVTSLSLSGNALTALYASLSLILYLLLPWTAVNLTDYFILGRSAAAEGNHHAYATADRAWWWSGIIAYALGFLGGVPFFGIQGYYQGPLATLLGGADISWAPELIISAGAYYLFERLLDPKARAFT